MDVLLQITTSPVKYELEITHAKLEYDQELQPIGKAETKPFAFHMQSQNVQVRLDTYEARKSLDMMRISDRIRSAAENGKMALQEGIRETVEDGKALAKINEGMTVNQLMQQKAAYQTPQLFTAFLPSGGAQISWEPSDLQMDYQRGDVSFDYDLKSKLFSYVPGSVRMKILDRGGVDIKYTGSPLYFPKSADPNYES